METNVKWVKVDTTKSQLTQNGSVLAEIDSRGKTNNITITIGELNYSFESVGFIKRKIMLKDNIGNIILCVETKNWYSSKYSFTYMNEEYCLFARNNPLAEFVIKANETEYLAYGLDAIKETGKLAIRINQKDNHVPVLFHVMLWSFFKPIAIENTIDFQWWMWGIS